MEVIVNFILSLFLIGAINWIANSTLANDNFTLAIEEMKNNKRVKNGKVIFKLPSWSGAVLETVYNNRSHWILGFENKQVVSKEYDEEKVQEMIRQVNEGEKEIIMDDDESLIFRATSPKTDIFLPDTMKMFSETELYEKIAETADRIDKIKVELSKCSDDDEKEKENILGRLRKQKNHLKKYNNLVPNVIYNETMSSKLTNIFIKDIITVNNGVKDIGYKIVYHTVEIKPISEIEGTQDFGEEMEFIGTINDIAKELAPFYLRDNKNQKATDLLSKIIFENHRKDVEYNYNGGYGDIKLIPNDKIEPSEISYVIKYLGNLPAKQLKAFMHLLPMPFHWIMKTENCAKKNVVKAVYLGGVGNTLKTGVVLLALNLYHTDNITYTEGAYSYSTRSAYENACYRTIGICLIDEAKQIWKEFGNEIEEELKSVLSTKHNAKGGTGGMILNQPQRTATPAFTGNMVPTVEDQATLTRLTIFEFLADDIIDINIVPFILEHKEELLKLGTFIAQIFKSKINNDPMLFHEVNNVDEFLENILLDDPIFDDWFEKVKSVKEAEIEITPAQTKINRYFRELYQNAYHKPLGTDRFTVNSQEIIPLIAGMEGVLQLDSENIYIQKRQFQNTINDIIKDETGQATNDVIEEFISDKNKSARIDGKWKKVFTIDTNKFIRYILMENITIED